MERVIARGETERVEFKEPFRYDIKTNKKNNSLKNEVSRAVCALLNVDGGIVLVGVANDKSVKGLERDLNLYGKQDQMDRMLIDVNAHITSELGIESKIFIEISFVELEKKKILKIEVNPSYEKPFYHKENFYVRDGPRTIELSGKKMGNYISSRTKRKLKSKEEHQEKDENFNEQTIINNKARDLLARVNKGNLSGIIPEFYELLQIIDDKEEIKWVEAELSGDIYEIGKDDPDYFEYRGIKGYISPYRIASLGNSTLEMIAADPNNIMKEFNYIPLTSISELEKFVDDLDKVGILTLSEEIIKLLKLDKIDISKLYFYFKPSAIVHVISNIKQKINKYLVKLIRNSNDTKMKNTLIS